MGYDIIYYLDSCDGLLATLETMPKRNNNDIINVDNLIQSINLDRGLLHGLSQLNHDELAILLADIANRTHIPTTTFKNARIRLPSFAALKWSNLADHFQLGASWDASLLALRRFESPRYRLPPSFHEAIFENAWRWQDIYCEKVGDMGEGSARMRLLDPVCSFHMRAFVCLLISF